MFILSPISGESQTILSLATSSNSSREHPDIPVITGKCNPTGELWAGHRVSLLLGEPGKPGMKRPHQIPKTPPLLPLKVKDGGSSLKVF